MPSMGMGPVGESGWFKAVYRRFDSSQFPNSFPPEVTDITHTHPYTPPSTDNILPSSTDIIAPLPSPTLWKSRVPPHTIAYNP